MNLQKEAGSFRDSSGQIVYNNGQVYRLIYESYQDEFDSFISSGLYASLLAEDKIIPHQRKELSELQLSPDSISKPRISSVLQVRKIRFISYPYEWCFEQLREAAILTLDIQLKALTFGFTLKDATAFNIQYEGNKPIFIDSLSFEKYTEGGPWSAYRQFCQHFLSPLLLWSYGYTDLNKLQILHLDGIPLKLVSSLLPWHTHLNPFIAIHIHYHSKMESDFSGKTEFRASKLKIPRSRQVAILEHLRSGIQGLALQKQKTEWSDYYVSCAYTDVHFREKEKCVASWLDRIKPEQTIDAGCNAGHFSQLASSRSTHVIAFDTDHKAIDELFLKSRKLSDNTILPLILNLSNLSPGIGWAGEERKSFLERAGKSSALLALALLHHLAIGNNVPFDKISDLFASMTDYLIIEFVPKADVQVARLLITKKDIFSSYTLDDFTRTFSLDFEILERFELSKSGRILFLMKNRYA
jgi:hypothetical protein